MSWPATFGIALVTAIGGCVGTGLLANACVGWYRITTREGAAGYFVVFLGLVGLVAGFVVGIVCARMAGSGTEPSFLRGLGLALGTAAALLLAATGLAFVSADRPPTLDGRNLVVETEVRLPAGLALPSEEEAAAYGYGWSVTLTADHGGRTQCTGILRPKQAVRMDDRWVIPGAVGLITRDSSKSLGVRLGERETQYFALPLASLPTRADMAWSTWLAAPYFGNLNLVPVADAVTLRYRVQLEAAEP